MRLGSVRTFWLESCVVQNLSLESPVLIFIKQLAKEDWERVSLLATASIGLGSAKSWDGHPQALQFEVKGNKSKWKPEKISINFLTNCMVKMLRNDLLDRKPNSTTIEFVVYLNDSDDARVSITNMINKRQVWVKTFTEGINKLIQRKVPLWVKLLWSNRFPD